MASFLPALGIAAGPIAKNVLSSLGIGLISYAALNALTAAVVASVQSNYGSLSGGALALANLLGVGQAIGIILGGIVARGSYAAITRMGKLV